MRLRRILPIVLFLCSSALPAEEGPIKIGYLADLSGKTAFFGTQSSYGARLAVDELKKEGIDTELYIEDTRNDPANAVTAAKFLINKRKVDVVISDLTPVTIASAPAVKAANKLFVHLSVAKSVNKSYEYGFLSFIDYEKSCKKVAEYWKSKGIIKTGMLKINLEFGEECLKGALEVYPDIYIFEYNSADDLKTAIAKFKAQNIETYLQSGYEIDLLNRIQASQQLNYLVPAACTEVIISKLVREKAGKLLEKDLYYGFREVSPDFIKLFLQEDSKRDLVNIEAAALAYTHIKQAVRAISACPNRTDTACQARVLAKSPPDPTIAFSSWKNRESDLEIVLKKFENSAFKVLVN